MRQFYEAFVEARKANKQKGFTLIELLVVIAIIAILAAIAIPAYNNYRQNAQQKAAMANARQCLTSVAAYLAEDPNNDPANATVPQGCTVGSNGDSCTCTVGSATVTCQIQDQGGTVSCSAI